MGLHRRTFGGSRDGLTSDGHAPVGGSLPTMLGLTATPGRPGTVTRLGLRRLSRVTIGCPRRAPMTIPVDPGRCELVHLKSSGGIKERFNDFLTIPRTSHGNTG
jgi:hypothetical protein